MISPSRVPPPPFGPDWRERTRQEVVALVARFVNDAAAGTDQRLLLQTALGDLRAAHAKNGSLVMSLHFPMLIVACGGRPDDDGLDVALVTTLIEWGVDLLDHLSDGELGPHWNGASPGTVPLVATGVLAALVPLALGRLRVHAARARLLHAAVGRGLVAMGAGQQQDLGLTGRPEAGLSAVQAAVAGKTGVRRGLYARLAALYAGADGSQADAWEAFGCEVGIARQLASDLADALNPDGSRDLRRGLATWPVAWALERAGPDDRGWLLDQLQRARTDGGAHARVRDALRRHGAVLRGALEVEAHKARGLFFLTNLSRREPAASALRNLVMLREG